MATLINTLNGLVWSPALIYLCLGAGLYFSVRMRFPQVRHFGRSARLLFSSAASVRGVSSFQAFALAISGRVGTGNIAGVATAIAFGGPGAVFWMWAIAFLGAGSAFVEAALAQIYKEEINGQFRGGPAYYIERGLKMKWYAVAFAGVTLLAAGVFMPNVQAHSIGAALDNAFAVPRWATGLGIAGLMAFIAFGGLRRLSRAAELIVPFMTIGYILVAVIVAAAHWREVPRVLGLIFESAFGGGAVFGGIVGQAIAWGVKRGVYSNEAGQGTAPMAAAAAEVKHPAEQGLVQAFSVYFDTWFVCSATAFMILLTGTYNVVDGAGGFLHQAVPGLEVGPAFTQAAVDRVIPGFGAGFVAVALFFFAFTTIMAYYFYAETSLSYLKRQDTKPWMLNLLRVVFVAIVYWGTSHPAELAWAMGDIGVGAMAWLNLIAILLLARPAVECLRDYEKQLKTGGPIRYGGPGDGNGPTSVWK
ncbi:MAG: sodium:alanine symporter [Opitutus sp.]|nr:sodium:alanine symporter [Opitutus sp.]